jgi:hypothetical protein
MLPEAVGDRAALNYAVHNALQAVAFHAQGDYTPPQTPGQPSSSPWRKRSSGVKGTLDQTHKRSQERRS